MVKKPILLTIACLSTIAITMLSTISVALADEGTCCFVVKTSHWTLTSDLRVVNMYRYYNTCGKKDVPVILVPGWTENHLIFDSSDSISDRSIANYLAEDMRDVWLVELRTHDTDGDPGEVAGLTPPAAPETWVPWVLTHLSTPTRPKVT